MICVSTGKKKNSPNYWEIIERLLREKNGDKKCSGLTW